MSIKNRYISVGSLFESELVQSLLFEAGAGWMFSGKTSIPVHNCTIAISNIIELSAGHGAPVGYKELNLTELVEIVKRDAPEVDNSLHVCKVFDNHISFEDSDVALTPDELSELLRVIQSISHRDFEITIRDDDLENGARLPITNLTINFK